MRFDIHDSRFVRRVLGGGDVGFADSYIAGEWDSPDLAKLLTAFSANFDRITRLLAGNPVMRAVNAVSHALNRNSKSGSKRNIHAHYDLGDDFYRLWLDPGMNYSSALFEAGQRDLAAGQRAKHAALAKAMDLQSGQTLVEIGCGWGDFARFAATEYQARVTAVTVSQAQHDYAARMVQQQGLSDRVTIKLCDYRDLEGRFDRVASIEMFEAVGEAYWPTYFRKLASLMAPGGRAGLQVITIREDLFEGYRRRPDFIQLNIFPGGMLPSDRRLRQETDRAGARLDGRPPLRPGLCRHPGRVGAPLWRTHRRGPRPGLRRPLRPALALLSRLLRGGLSHRAHRRDPAGAVGGLTRPCSRDRTEPIRRVPSPFEGRVGVGVAGRGKRRPAISRLRDVNLNTHRGGPPTPTFPARRREKMRAFEDYRFVSCPVAITGPVGWPVGEPPFGSTDTARVPAPTPVMLAVGIICTEVSKAATPRAIGLPPEGISHSSGERPSAAFTEAGVRTIALRPGS